MADSHTTDPSDQIRGHVHAAIARLESFCHTVGPLDPGDVTAAMAIAQVELDRAVSVLKRLPPP